MEIDLLVSDFDKYKNFVFQNKLVYSLKNLEDPDYCKNVTSLPCYYGLTSPIILKEFGGTRNDFLIHLVSITYDICQTQANLLLRNHPEYRSIISN